jgi:uncharacterized protein YbcV (DUF1398 family)
MVDGSKTAVAMACLHAAESGSMSFPEIVGKLMEAGFESYLIDYRRSLAIYYLADGDSVELPTHKVGQAVAPGFDAATVHAAIKEAQQQVPGYTYNGFCRKTAAAGCAGYIVSFLGRRVLYFGRTAETHVEHFPD